MGTADQAEEGDGEDEDPGVLLFGGDAAGVEDE